MLDVINIVLLVIVVALIMVRVYLGKVGIEKVVPRVDSRKPFEVVEQTEDSVLLQTKIEFANEGTQCATIMDCMVRPQLPYEQYDGMEARAKAELEGAAREDDYFEAVLIQKQESIFIHAMVRLTARKGKSLQEAVAHMVDLPLDIIYMETGRTPWHYSKVRVILTAQELSSLTGVELADD